VTDLHRRILWLTAAAAIAIVLAVIAVWVSL